MFHKRNEQQIQWVMRTGAGCAIVGRTVDKVGRPPDLHGHGDSHAVAVEARREHPLPPRLSPEYYVGANGPLLYPPLGPAGLR
jgi:hypothetical protein